SLSPMRDEQGQVNSIVVVMSDITETAVLQAQLRHSEKWPLSGSSSQAWRTRSITLLLRLSAIRIYFSRIPTFQNLPKRNYELSCKRRSAQRKSCRTFCISRDRRPPGVNRSTCIPCCAKYYSFVLMVQQGRTSRSSSILSRPCLVFLPTHISSSRSF